MIETPAGLFRVDADPRAPRPGSSDAELRESAEAFEAIFLRTLIDRMSSAQLSEGFFGGGAGSSTYQGMFVNHLAEELAGAAPLGIADMLMEHWSRAPLPEPPRAQAAKVAAVYDQVSSGFGWRTDPLDGRPRHHDGIDLPSPAGTPVLSVGDGRVIGVGRVRGYGLQVLVSHGGGRVSRYAHLSEASVEVGSRIDRGQPLGRVGSSGRATGPHLHLEILQNDRPLDPIRELGPALAPQVLGRGADESGRGFLKG